MQLSRNVVVASIQVDLRDDVLSRFQEDLLARVQESEPRAVILDVSGLETLDSEEFAALRRIITMVTIMGTQSLLVGLQPGVVSALIEMDADVDDLRTAIDLDAAFEMVEPELRAEPDDQPTSAPIEPAEERAVLTSLASEIFDASDASDTSDASDAPYSYERTIESDR